MEETLPKNRVFFFEKSSFYPIDKTIPVLYPEEGYYVCLLAKQGEETIMRIIRTLVADDDAAFRRRVSEFLASEPDIEVVGEAADGQEAILRARELKPDLVLMDVRMPKMNGVNATRQLTDEMPEVKVIMVSVFDLPEYREAAMVSGASGYVVKKLMVEQLVPETRRVCSL